MKPSTRNVYLDLFKYFLSFLVILIHVTQKDYVFHPLFRLAVPMFFLISGYFMYHPDKDRQMAKAKGFIPRTLKYFLIGFGFYIVFDFIMCYVDGHGVGYYFTTLFYKDFLLEFIFLNQPITYTGAQLWFLIALLVLSVVHWLAVKFDLTKYYKFAIPACFAIYFFFAGYMYLFQETDMPIRYTRNAWFMGLPMFSLGYLLAKVDLHKRSWYKYIYLVVGVAAFFFQIIEAGLAVMEMYISGVLSAVMLLAFFLGLKKTRCDFYYRWFGKDGPFYVYILHMAVSVVLSKLTSFDSGLVRCAVIFAVSFAIYELCFLLGKLWSKCGQKPQTAVTPHHG